MDLFWQVASWQQNKDDKGRRSASEAPIIRSYTSQIGGGYGRVLAGLAIALVGFLILLPTFASRNAIQDLIFIFYMLALAQYWNLLAGYGGLVSGGQQAFVGIGAYAMFAGVILGGWNPVFAIALGGVALALSYAAGTFGEKALRSVQRLHSIATNSSQPLRPQAALVGTAPVISSRSTFR